MSTISGQQLPEPVYWGPGGPGGLPPSQRPAGTSNSTMWALLAVAILVLALVGVVLAVALSRGDDPSEVASSADPTPTQDGGPGSDGGSGPTDVPDEGPGEGGVSDADAREAATLLAGEPPADEKSCVADALSADAEATETVLDLRFADLSDDLADIVMDCLSTESLISGHLWALEQTNGSLDEWTTDCVAVSLEDVDADTWRQIVVANLEGDDVSALAGPYYEWCF